MAHIAILMATLNGAAHIGAQLGSIADQSWRDWSLWISDDGSQDGTLDAIAAFKARHIERRIEVRRGPEQGSTRNFLSLLCDRGIRADLYALADQDDVWFPEKLARAAAAISLRPAGAVLYGARTMIADEHLRPITPSLRIRRPPSFGNALVQSIAGGNTVVMTESARRLAWLAGPRADPVCHDWWLYQLVTGTGGTVIHDPEPVLCYRQHRGNQIGSNMGVPARAGRALAVLAGRYADWNAQNIRALDTVRSALTPEARQTLRSFEALRRLRGRAALAALRNSGLERQTRCGQLSLAAAAAFGRL